MNTSEQGCIPRLLDRIPGLLLTILSRIPGLALCVLWIVHLSETIATAKHLEIISHPWTIFSVVMSILLFSFHTLVFFILTCNLYQRDIRYLPNNRLGVMDMEISLISLDMMWSGIWLLQLSAQYLLPKSHRIYTPIDMNVMILLYVLQILFSFPLLSVSIHRRDRARTRVSKKYKLVRLQSFDN